MKPSIHGKVIFTSEAGGRLQSSQERGHSGKRWIEVLLVFYGIMYGSRELFRVSRAALKRVNASERKKEKRA